MAASSSVVCVVDGMVWFGLVWVGWVFGVWLFWARCLYMYRYMNYAAVTGHVGWHGPH